MSAVGGFSVGKMTTPSLLPVEKTSSFSGAKPLRSRGVREERTSAAGGRRRSRRSFVANFSRARRRLPWSRLGRCKERKVLWTGDSEEGAPGSRLEDVKNVVILERMCRILLPTEGRSGGVAGSRSPRRGTFAGGFFRCRHGIT